MGRINLNPINQRFLLYTFLAIQWYHSFAPKVFANDGSKEFLHSLILNQEITLAKKTLVKTPIKVQQKDSKGNTPLHYAVTGNHVELVRLLLERKANFLAKNKEGMSPKDLAQKLGLIEIIELFQKQIEKNRRGSETFDKVYKELMEERPHCCRFYGKLKEDGSIRALIQKTMPNGECALEDYNPPNKNLFVGDCNEDKTFGGCKGHTQKPGACQSECGLANQPSCTFSTTFA